MGGMRSSPDQIKFHQFKRLLPTDSIQSSFHLKQTLSPALITNSPFTSLCTHTHPNIYNYLLYTFSTTTDRILNHKINLQHLSSPC